MWDGVSELVGLRWRNVHGDAITIEERYCRGDWGAPKSAASNATIPVNRAVIDRIERLKTMTVEVKAGRTTRHYRVVKSDGPDDLVFQSLQNGSPMRDNSILSKAYQARRAKPEAGPPQLALPAYILCDLAQAPRGGREGRASAHAPQSGKHDARFLPAVCSSRSSLFVQKVGFAVTVIVSCERSQTWGQKEVPRWSIDEFAA